MLYKHPRLLGQSLDSLRRKHSFIVDEWGRPAKEVEIFPQCLTYSLDYLRARAGFLIANGKADQHHLHRILRTADYLFARKLAGGRTAVEYQAFARAIKGQIAADQAQVVGVDGDVEGDDDVAPDDGEEAPAAAAEGAAAASGATARTLAEVAEEANEVASRKKQQPWETAGDKHMAKRLAEMESDRKQADAVAGVRLAIDEFLGADSAATVVVDGEVVDVWPKYMFRAT